MVLESLAIVLRARGGSNFLVHARGVDAKDAAECSREVAGVLAKFADAGGKGDTDRGGDNPPPFSFGEMLLLSGRHRVVYRLVGGVYLMVVAAVQANVLWLLNLLDACVRVVIGVAKSVEVTPDKLARRYPELYLALSAVLASGGQQPLTALQEADAELAALVPDASTSKGAMLGRLGRSASSLRMKGSGASASSNSATLAQRDSAAGMDDSVSATSKRTLADEVDDLAKVSFKLPPDALKPAVDAQKTQAARAQEAPVQADSSAAGPSEARAQDAGRAALAGTGLEGLFDPAPAGPSGSAATPTDPFGALGDFPGEGAAGSASDNPWASFDEGPATEPDHSASGLHTLNPLYEASTQPTASAGEGDWQAWTSGQPSPAQAHGQLGGFDAAATSAMATPTAEPSPQPEPEPAMPEEPPRDMTDADEDLIGGGKALELLEVWQGVFQGSRLVKAGLLGRVLGAPQLGHVAAEAVFKCYLFRKSSMSQRLILRGLQSAALCHAERAEAPDMYRASFASSATDEQARLLRYSLPAMACTPPLLLSLVRQSSARGVLLTCHILVSPSMPGSLEAVTIDLHIPSSSQDPLKVAPKAAWLPKARQLQWDIPELHSGSELTLRALLPPEAPGHSAEGARAVVHFQGPPDETLSGLTLESGPVHGRLMESSSRLQGKAVATAE
ncbi:g13174 [Coccomyxa viridis]|uniref:G13174 protein n=1 Tax=Coccomyxa viridis TaxID=1274662 RepID=A0ABP1GER2_9CHLO